MQGKINRLSKKNHNNLIFFLIFYKPL